MMILEHEAKALLRSVGVAVPDGTLIKPGSLTKPGEPRVKQYPVAVKAQVRSGGRGKQGGVIRAKVTEPSFAIYRPPANLLKAQVRRWQLTPTESVCRISGQFCQ